MKLSESNIRIGKKAFFLAIGILLSLMILSGILTRILPAGSYERIVSGGRTLVVDGSYREIPHPDYPFWRWFTAPFEILAGPDNITPIVIILFITIVGGSIATLESAGVMKALINVLVARFAKRKYLLIVAMITFFMVIASFIGIFEGMVPLVIFIIPIAVSLGWDSLVGLGMSLLPLAFGFAAAVTNPFTIAIAQKIADLPVFSGAPLRLVFLAVVYIIVNVFVISYAKKVERNPQSSLCYKEDEALRKKLRSAGSDAAETKDAAAGESQWRLHKRALIWFAAWITLAMVTVIVTARIPGLSSLAFPLMTVFFLVGGTGSGFLAGLTIPQTGKAFGMGITGLLPGIALVLMAYSVRHIITTGMIMDTILFRASELISRSTPMTAAFLVYAVTLVMNFFIVSASAKAFLMMPLLTPLADLVGITRQTAILAFNFGDGFSTTFFPTNPLLLIALSFSVVSYTKWIRWTWKLQLIMLAVTSAFLAFAVKTGFGPF